MGIWGYALGYFLSYAPYSALTAAMSHGILPGQRHFAGLELLPLSALASMVGMFIYLSVAGWWKYASRKTILGVSLPMPGRWTFLSGLCSAAIILTTTMAYTFDGVSILFMMVLMRGGVLVTAPLVDVLSGRKVRWESAAALALSLGAVCLSLLGGSDYRLSWVAGIDIAIYLCSYFVRMRFMSRLAKSDDPNASRRYFVEEQMVATPAAVLLLVCIALAAHSLPATSGAATVALLVRQGFAEAAGPALGWLLLIGFFSQGTGVFGALIMLDKRENSFCMPVNRASSVLAGVVASYALAFWLGQSHPGTIELVSAALLIVAILMLSLPPLFRKKVRT